MVVFEKYIQIYLPPKQKNIFYQYFNSHFSKNSKNVELPISAFFPISFLLSIFWKDTLIYLANFYICAYMAKVLSQHSQLYLLLQMSAQKQSSHPDPSQQSELSSEIQLPASEPKHPASLPAAQVEFQKNYPKNIFIPLIEYLTELGYREAYEKCVGRRSQFQGKNVVSLGSMHLLITQDWFTRNINKEAALAHISNKIFINSKIKKKLFHILIAHVILMTNHLDLKDFKRRVSRQANTIARRPLPQDDLFSYPNAIIYLLHLFLKILMLHAGKKGYLKLEEELEKLSLEDAPAADAKNKSAGSKEQYKFYVKEIVHVLNGKGLQIHSLTDILEQTRQCILQKDKNLREKYQLIDGIPNWAFFIEIVVVRCFQYKRKDLKITNFIFNQWINDCKTKMLCVFSKVTEPKQPNEQEKYWETGSIEWKHDRFSFSSENWNAEPKIAAEGEKESDKDQNTSLGITAGKSKEFTPIILSKISQK